MSAGDPEATSFGHPNARPPTPQRTPTTAVFSASVFETPKQSSGHFDDVTGWTPRFAEDYSVFNSTPGNLRGSSAGGGGSNLDFAPHSPAPASTGKKRPLSAEGVALEVAPHANHFSANPKGLEPVDPARQLPSSPDRLTLVHKDASADSNITPKASQSQPQSQPQSNQRSSKKHRRGTAASGAAAEKPQAQTQTATPPPSSRGGRKKLAPKLNTDIMQNQTFGQPDFSSVRPLQQPHLNTTFVTGSPEDVFGYPVGPATAPPISGTRPFWGMEMDTTGMAMNVDLSTAGAELFQTNLAQNSSPHRPMNSMDWARANQMFQQTAMVAQPQQQQHQPQQQEQQQQQQQPQQPQVQNTQQNRIAKRERPIAPKTANMPTPNIDQPPPGQNFSFDSFQMHGTNDSFSASPGGVDPGLLFSRPSSSANMDGGAMSMSMSMSMSMDPSPQQPTSSAPAILPQTTVSMNLDSCVATRSPTKKQTGWLCLSRSLSEGARGGKRTVGGGRHPLPTLAPARSATVHQPILHPPVANQNNSSRSQSQGGRSGGRTSPLKSSHHHRLPSLTSIPENTPNIFSRARCARRTSVKLVIDENGRARAETFMDEDDYDEPVLPGSSQRISPRNSWGGLPASDEKYSSSSDDEPIVIPSRNTSFNLPEPLRSSGSTLLRPLTATSGTLQRSYSDRRPSSSSSFRRNSRVDLNTSQVDLMDIDQPSQPPPRPSTGSSLGDAAAELRKVMQAGNGRRPSNVQQQQQQQQQAAGGGSGGSSGHRQRFTPGQRSSSSTISEVGLATPSPTQNHNEKQGQIRCVCNRPEAEVDGRDSFLIKCDSCEYMLHGHCVDVPTLQDVPHVYICAFCANTPNMRGGRMRYTGRGNNLNAAAPPAGGGMMGPPASAASALSPLAHKSFRSFR